MEAEQTLIPVIRMYVKDPKVPTCWTSMGKQKLAPVKCTITIDELRDLAQQIKKTLIFDPDRRYYLELKGFRDLKLY